MSTRNPATLGEWGPDGRRSFAAESYWRQPLAWDREAAAAGTPARVFSASLADLFEGDHERTEDGWHESRNGVRPDYVPMLERLWKLMLATPNLRWLLLTKRPWNMAAWAESAGWPANAWAGTTIEDQPNADERLPWLLRVPAPVRFVSVEPQLGLVRIEESLTRWEAARSWQSVYANGLARAWHGVDWVISGAEKLQPGARPGRRTEAAWVRDLRDQCVRRDVPLFVKQLDVGGVIQEAPEIDGRTWQEVPQERAA